jgi:phage host-nuclease inhibitor protein Gam
MQGILYPPAWLPAAINFQKNQKEKNMARLKPSVKKIESLEDANLTLKEIGLLERELEVIDGDAHKQIAEIKTTAVKAGEPIRKRLADLSALLGAFAEYNRADLFRDKKTVQISFGIFGYRKSTSIGVRKTTLDLLEKHGLGNYIRVKKEPDKEAMSAMDDDTLSQVDAWRKVKDEFFCQADREEINKDLLKEQM